MNTISQHEYAALIVYGCMGLIVVQGVTLCLAHALGPGGLLLRTAITWGWGAAALFAWWMGIYLGNRERGLFSQIIGALCVVPLFVLAVETPLWIVRLTLGWRLTHAEQSSDSPSSLADFFSVTSLVAATFGLAQLGRDLMRGGQDFWLTLGIAWLIVAATSAAALLPLLFLTLRLSSTRAACAFAIVAAGVAAMVPWIFAVATRRGARWDWEMTGIAVVFVCIAAGLLAVLHTWRQFGWRLTIGRRL